VALFGPPNVERLEARGDLNALAKAAQYKKDPAVREAARQALIRSMDRLIQLLQSKHLPHLVMARDALVTIGPPARDKLIFILREGHLHRRQDAAHVLGMMGDPAAVPALSLAMHNPDGLLRVLCVQALAKIGGDDARAVVQQALNDGDPAVADAARKGLAALDARA
jgi:HEAT repeat protein